jgi:hypothetical protein
MTGSDNETGPFWAPWRRLVAVALGVVLLFYAGGGFLTGAERGVGSIAWVVIPAVAALVLTMAFGQKKITFPKMLSGGVLIGLGVLASAVLRLALDESGSAVIGSAALSFLGGLLISGAFLVQG